MEDQPRSPLAERIAARLEALGKSEREVSMAAFGNSGTLRNIRVGTSKSPGIELIAKLAPELDTSPAWLAFGQDHAEPAESPSTGDDHEWVESEGRAVPVREFLARRGRRSPAVFLDACPLIGEVAAGHWLDVDTAADEPEGETAPIPLDPSVDPAAQFAVRVRGESINRIARHGQILICARVPTSRRMPRDGDLVIVERRRNDGSEIERTAKRLQMRGREMALWPVSTDPRWQTAIEYRPDEADETASVQIIGIALAVHQRIGRDIFDSPR